MDKTANPINTEDKIHTIQLYLNNNSGGEYYYILSNIIKTYNIEHSSNMNGIFLNLSTLHDNIINDIYLNFINSQNIEQSTNVDPPLIPIVSAATSVTLVKDKLTMDKFDNYLLQLSRINIGI
jgi:hypothetical protein